MEKEMERDKSVWNYYLGCNERSFIHVMLVATGVRSGCVTAGICLYLYLALVLVTLQPRHVTQMMARGLREITR